MIKIKQIFILIFIQTIFLSNLYAENIQIGNNISAEPINYDASTINENEILLNIEVNAINNSEILIDEKTYDHISIKSAGKTTEIGKPELPLISRYVAIPKGATVNAEIVASEYVLMNGYSISPAQVPVRENQDFEQLPFAYDAKTYQADEMFPQQLVSIDNPTTMRGQDLVLVRITPVQFNPITEELKAYSNIQIKLTIGGGNNPSDSRLNSKTFDNILTRLAINHEDQVRLQPASAVTTASDDGELLLIITHSDFLDAAERLADWKNKKGINTVVKTTDDPEININGNDINANAKRLRDFIKSAYENWSNPPSYLLLIGDVRLNSGSNDMIPTNYGLSTSGQNIGTDLYYTTMDGDSDTTPDIILGRLTVNTVDEANRRINAIIDYEKNPPLQESFYKNAAMTGFFQDENFNGTTDRRYVQTVEDLAIYLSDEAYLNSYSIDRLYDASFDADPANRTAPGWWTNNSNYFFTEGPAANWCGESDCNRNIPDYLLIQNGFTWEAREIHDDDGNIIQDSPIYDSINSGRFLVAYRGHGSTTAWSNGSGLGNLMLSRTAISGLTNDNLRPVIWSIACNTGWFDAETDYLTESYRYSMSEAFGGQRDDHVVAIGIIAASRTSDGDMNERLLWGLSDAIWPGFLENYPGTGSANNTSIYEIGAALNYGKLYMQTNYSSNDPNILEMLEMYHWFGDPTMKIWTAKPETLNATHNENLSNSTSIMVTVDVSDALIAISYNGQLLGKKLSVANSPVEINWSTPLADNDRIDIVVTKHNYRPSITVAEWNTPEVCIDFTTDLNEHVAANRATITSSGWWWSVTKTYKAVGSNEVLGTSGSNVVTLKEDPQGYFSKGECLIITPLPPVIDTLSQLSVSKVSDNGTSITFEVTVTGTASDPNNDIKKIQISGSPKMNDCIGTTEFNCSLQIKLNKDYLPQTLENYIGVNAEDMEGQVSDTKFVPSVTFAESTCIDSNKSLNEHYAEDRVWSECTGAVFGDYCWGGEWNIYTKGSNEFISHNGNDIVTLHEFDDSGVWHIGSCPN